MAKKNFIVTRAGSYGKPGEVVKVEVGKDGLSKRQKVMLKPFEAPTVEVVDEKATEALQVELDAANDEIAGLKKQLAAAKKAPAAKAAAE